MALTDTALDAAWVPADSFANRLALIRNERHLTQQQAAAACELDDGSWSNWENGRKPRGLDEVVRKISRGLGVDRDWLMWGAEGATRCPSCGQPEAQHLQGGSPTGARSRCSSGFPSVCDLSDGLDAIGHATREIPGQRRLAFAA